VCLYLRLGFRCTPSFNRTLHRRQAVDEYSVSTGSCILRICQLNNFRLASTFAISGATSDPSLAFASGFTLWLGWRRSSDSHRLFVPATVPATNSRCPTARTFNERSSHSPRGAAGHNPLRDREWPVNCGIPARYHHPRGTTVPCAWTVRIGLQYRFPVTNPLSREGAAPRRRRFQRDTPEAHQRLSPPRGALRHLSQPGPSRSSRLASCRDRVGQSQPELGPAAPGKSPFRCTDRLDSVPSSRSDRESLAGLKADP